MIMWCVFEQITFTQKVFVAIHYHVIVVTVFGNLENTIPDLMRKNNATWSALPTKSSVNFPTEKQHPSSRVDQIGSTVSSIKEILVTCDAWWVSISNTTQYNCIHMIINSLLIHFKTYRWKSLSPCPAVSSSHFYLEKSVRPWQRQGSTRCWLAVIIWRYFERKTLTDKDFVIFHYSVVVVSLNCYVQKIT